MERSTLNLVTALLVAVVCSVYSEEALHSTGLESSSSHGSGNHSPQKRSTGVVGDAAADALLLSSDDSYPFVGDNSLDKRGTLFRFGKRGGSLFRFGKRGGSLFRFGKRQGGTLFRFGRSGGLPSSALDDLVGSDSRYGDVMAKRTLFRFGKRADLDDFGYPSYFLDSDSKRNVNGFHWGSDE